MKSFGSIFVVLMLISVVFYIMISIGNEGVTNSNLDTDSVILIAQIDSGVNSKLNFSNSFDEFQSNLTTNATFDSADVFAQEYLEGKSQGQSKQGIIANIIKIPDLLILSLGIPLSALVWVRSIILLIITVIIGFATYRAIFGGGKVTDN